MAIEVTTTCDGPTCGKDLSSTPFNQAFSYTLTLVMVKPKEKGNGIALLPSKQGSFPAHFCSGACLEAWASVQAPIDAQTEKDGLARAANILQLPPTTIPAPVPATATPAPATAQA